MKNQTHTTHTNGFVHHLTDSNITVFEDNQDVVIFYAWRGTFADHDTAKHSPHFATSAEAIAWVEAHA